MPAIERFDEEGDDVDSVLIKPGAVAAKVVGDESSFCRFTTPTINSECSTGLDLNGECFILTDVNEAVAGRLICGRGGDGDAAFGTLGIE